MRLAANSCFAPMKPMAMSTMASGVVVVVAVDVVTAQLFLSGVR